MTYVKRLFGIRNKIFALMIITCFVPFICFSLFVYNNYSRQLEESTVNNSLRDIEQSDKLLFLNMWLVEYAAKNMCRDDEFLTIFTEDGSGEEYERYVEKSVSELSMIKGVVAFGKDGAKYEYGHNTGSKNKANFIMENGVNEMSANRITWSGRIDNLFLAGVVLTDGNNNEVARLFFLVSDEIFDGIYNNESGKNTIICDELGNIVFSNGNMFPEAGNIWNTTIALNDFIYNQNTNSLYTDIDGEKYICVKYKSQIMEWYCVEIMNSDVFLKNVKLTTNIALVIGIAAFVLILVIYLVMIRHFFKPVKVIDKAMRNVVLDDFNIRMDIHTNDEFSVIARGFNCMLDEIQNLLKEMEKSNEEKLQIELETLQYQINPHFLYNVLAATRFIALKNGQSEVADTLLKLSRLFSLMLNSAEKDVTVDEEINVMGDYMDLMNLRYDNKIEITLDIEEASRNAKLPGFVLQPLIENAITHGAAARIRKGEQGKIRVASKMDNDVLVLSVYDNGYGMDKEKIQQLLQGDKHDKHIGFENVRKRLFYRYGERQKIEINSVLGEFTEITIIIG